MTPLRRLHLGAWTALLLCLAHGWEPGIALVAPIPLLLALRGATVRSAFYVGLLCGACEAAILAGVMRASLVLFVALCLDYALLRALVAVLAVTATFFDDTRAPRSGWLLRGAATLIVPAAWVVVEWVHCQIPYSLPNLLGDTQHVGPLLPLARVGGTFLLSFLIVWWAALAIRFGAVVWEAARQRRQSRSGALGVVAHAVGMVAVGVAVFVALRLAAAATMPTIHHGGAAGARLLRVNVVQGGMPTWLYSYAEDRFEWASLPWRVYATLSRRAPAGDLMIWPETAVWRTWGDDRDYELALRGLARDLRTDLLVGAPRRDAGGQLYNSGILITSAATATATATATDALIADKRRLVVRAEARFTPGLGAAVLDARAARLGVIFCLESVAPAYAREVVLAGAELVVVLAEGSRMGQTPVARMHAQRSIVRAVEVGRAVVHAGQHGYSTVIGPDGVAQPLRAPFTSTVLAAGVPIAVGETPFVRWGAWVVVGAAACLLFGYAVVVFDRLSRRTNKKSVA